ncbi:MAG: EAL domain-containing protein [Gammaproteobacteria bacterium]|nr:EAL domain-containing protein [Gammaproteobacteria bacterium]
MKQKYPQLGKNVRAAILKTPLFITHWLMKLLIIIIIFLLAATSFPLQANSANVDLKHFSTREGLSQSVVWEIERDRDGYLWLGTEEGVNRFDAYRLGAVPGPDGLFNARYVGLIHRDREDYLWISVAPNLNYRLSPDGDQYTLMTLPQRTPENNERNELEAAFEADSGDLWLINYEEAFRYDYGEQRLESVVTRKDIWPEEFNNKVFRAVYKFNHYLLLATTAGLYAVDLRDQSVIPIKHQPIEILNDEQNNVKGLFKLPDGALYVATVSGLTKIDQNKLFSALTTGQKPLFKFVNKELNIWDIELLNGDTWVATDDGLYQLENDQLEFTFRFSDLPFNLFDNDIIKLKGDREGNLWLGSREDGFFKWFPNNAIVDVISNVRGKKKMLPSNLARVIKKEGEQLLIGTSHGLSSYSMSTGDTNTIYEVDDERAPFTTADTYQIVRLDNYYWVHRNDGIKLLDVATMQESSRPLPEKTIEVLKEPIWSSQKLSDHEVLILQNKKGAIFDSRSGQIKEVESLSVREDKDAYFNILTSNQPADSQFYLTQFNRVDVYDPVSGSVKNLHTLKHANPKLATAVSIFKTTGQVWVNYYGHGIYIIDDQTGEELSFLDAKSLGSGNLLDIFEDANSNLWISSNDGLLRVNRTNFTVEKFNRRDGLPTNEFVGGTTTSLDGERFAMSTNKGVIILDLTKLVQKRRQTPKVHLTGLNLLSNSEQNFGDNKNIQLQYDDFGLKVEFSALIFHKTSQVKYRYWIEGDSKTSPAITSTSEILFPKFNPGRSVLKIAAIDYKSGDESEPLSFNINALPAPWLSLPAYIAYIATFVLTVGILFYLRHRRQVALLSAHDAITRSEKRLQLALTGSDSGLWDWRSENNLVYEPRLDFAIDNKEQLIGFNQRLNYIHPDDQSLYASKWQNFLLQSEKGFEHVYRIKNENNEWRWFRDLARVSELDGYDNPKRVTGTYTDITTRKDTQDKMRLFFEAFENTRDIIIILDKDFMVNSVNQSFTKTTGYDMSSVLGNALTCLTKDDINIPLTISIKDQLSIHEQCESEGFLLRQFQKPLPVLINATRFSNEDNEQYYVITVTDISEQKQAQEKLKKLANYDPLTNLPNRALLMDRITHAIEHCYRRKQKLAVFFIDLDRFKQINDTLGHDAGDMLLITVADILKFAVREDDTVARLGGDEFVIVLEDVHSIEIATRIANIIINNMAEPFEIKEQDVSTSPSIGISIFPDDGDTAEQLIKAADMAMYHAKNLGRNNFQFFRSSMNQEAHSRMSMESMLRSAIKRREFTLVYQPQVCLQTQKIKGFEALARWQQPNGEIISPLDFIPVAEEVGLIIPLTEQLIEQALVQLDNWHKAGFAVGVAVNLSARHLRQYDIVRFMKDSLTEYNFTAGQLEFELTESMLMTDIDVSLPLVKSLKKMNIELALDDFGTGYSSLKYLHQFPIHKMKIDRSFVSLIGQQSEAEAIIETIIALARSLNKKSVIEGVETFGQLEFVRKLGADYIQGYYFSKPVSGEASFELLERDWSDKF